MTAALQAVRSTERLINQSGDRLAVDQLSTTFSALADPRRGAPSWPGSRGRGFWDESLDRLDEHLREIQKGAGHD